MLRMKFFGSSNVGLYMVASNRYFIYHSLLDGKKVLEVKKELKAYPIPVFFTETLITSPFIVGNSRGVLIPRLFEDYALTQLRNSLSEMGVEIGIVDHKYNALGNTVVVNDKGAIVSPIIPLSIKKMISDVLDVEVSTSTIGRFSYPGSLLVVNNRVGLSSPVIRDDEKSHIQEVLKIKVYEGTINKGVEFIKLGLIVNDYGVVVGDDSTGAELMNITSIFGG